MTCNVAELCTVQLVMYLTLMHCIAKLCLVTKLNSLQGDCLKLKSVHGDMLAMWLNSLQIYSCAFDSVNCLLLNSPHCDLLRR